MYHEKNNGLKDLKCKLHTNLSSGRSDKMLARGQVVRKWTYHNMGRSRVTARSDMIFSGSPLLLCEY